MSGKHSQENNGRTNLIDKKKTKENQNSKIINNVFRLLALIFFIITIIFYISVLSLNLLPGIYVTAFTIFEGLFTFAIVVGLAKKHKRITINVVCLIVALIVSIVYILATNYVFATIGFLGNMFSKVEETEEYYLVVKKSSKYDSIDDIVGKDVYVFQMEEEVKEQVKAEADINLKEQENLTQIGQDLLDNKVEAILVSSTQNSMLKEEIENFEANTKTINTTTHKIQTTANIETPNTKYNIKNGIFNIYISGIDTSGSISNVSRSDANILVTVNTNTHEVLLTSIPRDYYVTLHSKRAKDKLTHSGIYGINETVTTVEDLLDVDINYYVRVNFTTVIKLVDTLGGVDVYSDYDFSAGGYHYNKGYNHLNGNEALRFSRERHSFASGDNQRVKNQQHVIEAIINKVLNNATILTRYTDILNALNGSFQTNIDQNDISNLVKDQLQNMTPWKIKNNALSGTGASSSTYSMGSQKLYVMIPDTTSVEKAKDQIKSVMGE